MTSVMLGQTILIAFGVILFLVILCLFWWGEESFPKALAITLGLFSLVAILTLVLGYACMLADGTITF